MKKLSYTFKHGIVEGSNRDDSIILTPSMRVTAIYGNGGDDYISDINTPTRNQILSGGAGDDFIFSSKGADRISGGSGDDIIAVDSSHSVVRVNGGSGEDTLITEEPARVWAENRHELHILTHDGGEIIAKNIEHFNFL